MSDFLKNLVGRSLGTIEVVRPRVPSIYEPYRRGSGLLGSHPGLRHAISGPGGEPSAEEVTNSAQIADRMNPFQTREANLSSESNVAQFRESGNRGPNLQAARARAEATSPLDAQAGPTESNPTHLPGKPEPIPITALAQRGTAFEATAESPASRYGSRGLVSQNATLVPSITANQPQPASSSVRPPLAASWGTAKSPDASSSTRQPKPAIEVSIGKVEVRAVFPEPAVRRAPPPRSRPTVSLDDYLNRRNRGRR